MTLLDGIRAAAARRDIVVRHTDGVGTAAVELAAECEVAVVVVGCSHRDEGEWILRAGGDRRTLTLSPEDEQLVTDVVRANPRTVVLLMGGSALVTDRWHHLVPAMAMTWYPGMEGGHGVADVLFGDVEAQGRLPLTWPGSSTRLPPFRRFARRITYGPLHGYRMMEATGQVPSFPFGFGLGYAAVTVDGASLVEPPGAAGRDGRCRAVVRVRLTNSSDRDGVEVVQAYVAEALGSHPDPLRTLRGAARAEVPAGSTVEVDVPVDLPLGATEVLVGRSSAADELVGVPLD